MANTKAEVWALAKETGTDDFISAVSRAFGKDAIADIAIANPGDVRTTSDDLLQRRVRIQPGSRMTSKQIKQAVDDGRRIDRMKK